MVPLKLLLYNVTYDILVAKLPNIVGIVPDNLLENKSIVINPAPNIWEGKVPDNEFWGKYRRVKVLKLPKALGRLPVNPMLLKIIVVTNPEVVALVQVIPFHEVEQGFVVKEFDVQDHIVLPDILSIFVAAIKAHKALSWNPASA